LAAPVSICCSAGRGNPNKPKHSEIDLDLGRCWTQQLHKTGKPVVQREGQDAARRLPNRQRGRRRLLTVPLCAADPLTARGLPIGEYKALDRGCVSATFAVPEVVVAK
jgi:hypothetical protein